MKFTVTKPTEIEVSAIRVSFQPRYDGEEGAMPMDFPLREGAAWTGTIDLATRRIIEWPADKTGEYEFYEKVCDTGTYALLGPSGEVIAELTQEYVPDCVPGNGGDYIEFKIKDGVLKNFFIPTDSDDFEEFFPTE